MFQRVPVNYDMTVGPGGMVRTPLVLCRSGPLILNDDREMLHSD